MQQPRGPSEQVLERDAPLLCPKQVHEKAGGCGGLQRSTVPILLFLLPMQMKSKAFSALKLPRCSQQQVGSSPSVQALAGSRQRRCWWRGDRVCPHLGLQS